MNDWEKNELRGKVKSLKQVTFCISESIEKPSGKKRIAFGWSNTLYSHFDERGLMFEDVSYFKRPVLCHYFEFCKRITKYDDRGNPFYWATFTSSGGYSPDYYPSPFEDLTEPNPRSPDRRHVAQYGEWRHKEDSRGNHEHLGLYALEYYSNEEVYGSKLTYAHIDEQG
jgi:hypothetical protein